MLHGPRYEIDRLERAKRLCLFLDYDGTLAEFAPTPDDIFPDQELVALLADLASQGAIRIAIISGRRLDHIIELLPASGILLAGTYGIEYLTPNGERIDRLEYGYIRPFLEELKPHWADLIRMYEGFYLEDKGWSLAIHARYAGEDEACQVLEYTRQLAKGVLPSHIFQILDGNKFLEVAPYQADKGRAIAYFHEKYPWEQSLPVYIGDDDKDEKAFVSMNAFGGVTILVSKIERETSATLRLESIVDVRGWLKALVKKAL